MLLWRDMPPHLLVTQRPPDMLPPRLLVTPLPPDMLRADTSGNRTRKPRQAILLTLDKLPPPRSDRKRRGSRFPDSPAPPPSFQPEIKGKQTPIAPEKTQHPPLRAALDPRRQEQIRREQIRRKETRRSSEAMADPIDITFQSDLMAWFERCVEGVPAPHFRPTYPGFLFPLFGTGTGMNRRGLLPTPGCIDLTRTC